MSIEQIYKNQDKLGKKLRDYNEKQGDKMVHSSMERLTKNLKQGEIKY